MPYLIDPTAAAASIGAKCTGSVGPDDSALLNILNYLLPRVEDAMGVASLTFGETVDTFDLPVLASGVQPRDARLRLSNGYVENSEDFPVTITGPDGLPVSTWSIDLRLGVVILAAGWKAGSYTVTYSAGFSTPEVDPDIDPPLTPLFEDVPLWIEGVVVTLLVQWYRVNQKVLKLPDNVRYGELMVPLQKDITTRVYMRYQRPRDCVWPVNSTRADGMRV
jgi:hypothetical protein